MSEGDPKRKPQALGRGLAALFGEADAAPRCVGADTRGGVRELGVDAIAPHADQPRRHFDARALDELTQSIRAHGVVQPIIVRARDGGGFEIVAGERRWRAAKAAGLATVPAVVRTVADESLLEVALLENIQRADLNAIEEADAYRRLIEEYGHTQEALASIVHKSRSHVANLLRLLDLPDPVRAHVAEGRLTLGHAKVLMGADDPVARAEEAVARGLSVRALEASLRNAKPRARRAPRAAAPSVADPDIALLETHLSDLIGLDVAISAADGAGTVAIRFASLEQLDMVCQRLTGERF